MTTGAVLGAWVGPGYRLSEFNRGSGLRTKGGRCIVVEVKDVFQVYPNVESDRTQASDADGLITEVCASTSNTPTGVCA